ncbi:hypothetical protein [Nesterenkonia ebinurensis]|uniref:hypothetical protein n=1 Tax=Nesterenkonia ebinurensis TaxID=2608252 RepID=UPI00123D2894|nr:hypothetical protein [Nesterenkonia ebinurensis]
MNQQPSFDPWTSGTRAYRAALILGMAVTFLGIIAVIAASLTDSTVLRNTGLGLIGAGILSHLTGIGLRRRQAAQILRDRKNQGR